MKRIIYDERYYQLKKISQNREFILWIKDFYGRHAKFGCPIPRPGFRDWDERFQWRNRVGHAYQKALTGKVYLRKKRAIDDLIPVKTEEEAKEIDRLELDLERRYLPPVASGYEFEDVLKKFGLDPGSKDDKEWLDHYVFFGRKEALRPLYAIEWRVPKKLPSDAESIAIITKNIKKIYPPLSTEVIDKVIDEVKRNGRWRHNDTMIEPELWIRFYGYSKRSDLPVSDLAEWQKSLPDYVGHNKTKDGRVAKRNAEIIACYLEEKDKILNNKSIQLPRLRLPVGESLAALIVKKLKKKYPKINEGLVNRVISDWNRKADIQKVNSNSLNKVHLK